ncbi:MAG: SDR family NAD(P)-dependent oxidoreductase [Gammaproteobacteria bacterium]|nr:SDR family NAD(P)-dependent oxidoreductase [Gammaproteobacteria bacterium]MDE0223979.1 SDR family NAD(P)-dependent oxidoreductase [Gammaproteobacteria bacterium]
MKEFTGKLAVITGGGSGIGRALARQLVAEGCSVATCDILEDNLAETRHLCESEAVQGCTVSTHHCDVALEDDVLAFRDAVKSKHNTNHIDLLFNNAGVGGGSSFVDEDREEWERTFNICWFGVYYCARAFMPMLVASDDAHMVNTSSVNGFWATLGPGSTHSAYSAAKFAVKGFTEALITDFANNAPHVKVSVVMPGHIGTSIGTNVRRIMHGGEVTEGELARARKRYMALGVIDSSASDEQVREVIDGIGEWFRQSAPTTAEQAASIILDGVRQERWRILVGDDAHHLDEMVRAAPEEAYTEQFLATLRERTEWNLG